MFQPAMKGCAEAQRGLLPHAGQAESVTVIVPPRAGPERRARGATGIDVGVVGRGTWQTFDVRAARSVQPVADAALAGGTDFFDSSPMYGAAERVLAETLGPRRPRVVYLGRLERYKRIDVLLRAAAIVSRRVPELAVVVIGEGRDRARLERVARAAGVAGRTRLTGFAGPRASAVR